MANKAPEDGEVAPEPAVSPVIEEVRQLVELMVEHDLGEVDIKDGDRKIRLRRGAACTGPAPAAAAVPQAAAPVAPPPPAPEAAAPGGAAEAAAEELIEVRSPMVGTYYSSASPESEPYADIGMAVDEDTVVCIVEAMKVMNEVKAECAGTVAEICVQNAQPVEYGQVLFRVRHA
jgi:acetyl-CoA carboxylase biotin carboxyl carrier protein